MLAFLTWLGWFLDRINTVVGCSGSLASALRCLRDVLIAPLWVVLALSDWLSELINTVIGCLGRLTSVLCHDFRFLYVELHPSVGLCVELGLEILDWIV